MKRMYYVSRFARPLSSRDLTAIREASVRNNRKWRITGMLVCLGDTFFQVLEGPNAAVDRLYYERILVDDRHRDIVCLRAESGLKRRMFPRWHMNVFNLNEQTEALPFAFREMLGALLESHHTLAQYTQPSIFGILERGVHPASIAPRRKFATVLYSDIIGFSRFAEHLAPRELIALVNSHIDVCTTMVSARGGEVNKLTGDGVLAYFAGNTTDAGLEAATEILNEMKRRREGAPAESAQQFLYGGVGLSHGLVYEGNVGQHLKRDFTILGNTVNLASRLESMTRDLEVRLTLGPSIVRRATHDWPFVSLGKHRLKGQSKPLELFTLGPFGRADVAHIYQSIETHVRETRRVGRKRGVRTDGSG